MTKICLILEGTYPYATGGVSTWVHKLVSGLAEFEFSIVHIFSGSKPKFSHFSIPKNISQIIRFPLLIDKDHSNVQDFIEAAPEADLYHALSTGFAGFFGAEIKRQKKQPFILTEHGIYWYEIEIGASELECGFNITKTQCSDLALGKTWYYWLNVFKNFARYSYRNADAISTVCYANLEKQLSLNADPNKCHVISNGVDIDSGIRTRKSPGKPVNIALIGRVTPIKQIEIFIQACVPVKSKLPAAKFYVIGPVDHDRDYFMRMVALKNQLNLDELIFTGEINTKEILNRLDLVVLTSKSEGEPFALLESMAAGVPVIATDVGGCADVVNGLEDGFDAAGKICSVGDVAGISAAMIELLTKPVLWRQCAQAGINRVSSFYRSEMFLNAYRKLYLKHTVRRANFASTILAG